jgi:hypothetical protein
MTRIAHESARTSQAALASSRLKPLPRGLSFHRPSGNSIRNRPPPPDGEHWMYHPMDAFRAAPTGSTSADG